MLWQIPDAALIGGAFFLDTRAKGENTIIPDSIESVITGGYNTAGDGGGAEFKKVAGPLSDGASFQSADGAWWQLSSVDITAKMFDAGDTADDTAALLNAIEFADGRQIAVNQDSVLTVDNLSTDKPIRLSAAIGINATIKHKANSSTACITVTQDADPISFKADNIVFDGNRANQVNRTQLLVIDNVHETDFNNCTFTGSYESAIFGSNDLDFFTVRNCEFLDAAYHGGALNLNAYYVSLGGVDAKLITFENNRFIGNNSPPDASRATGGVIVSFSGEAPCNFVDNYFENIGTYSSGNFVGNIDLYTNGGKTNVIGNRAVNAYYTAWKLQNASDLIVAFNRVESFAAASTVDVGAAILQNARSYPSALKYAVVYGNYIFGDDKNNLIAYYFQGNANYSTDGVIMTNNIAEGCARLTSLQYVTYAELLGNIADNMVNSTLTGVVLIENSDVAPGAPTTATVKISGGRLIADTGSLIFARTNVSNLCLTVEKVTMSSPSSNMVSARNLKQLIFKNNHFLTGGVIQLDVQNLAFVDIGGNTADVKGTMSSSGVTSNNYQFNPAWDIQGSAIFNPSLIAPGDMVVTNVTVTGASLLGSIAQASFSLPLAGIVLNCFMSAANTATVQFINPPNNPTGSIDLNSGTITVKALQRV